MRWFLFFCEPAPSLFFFSLFSGSRDSYTILVWYFIPTFFWEFPIWKVPISFSRNKRIIIGGYILIYVYTYILLIYVVYYIGGKEEGEKTFTFSLYFSTVILGILFTQILINFSVREYFSFFFCRRKTLFFIYFFWERKWFSSFLFFWYIEAI